MPRLRQLHAQSYGLFPLTTLGRRSPLLENLGIVHLSSFFPQFFENDGPHDEENPGLIVERSVEALRSLSALTRLVVQSDSWYPDPFEFLELLTPGPSFEAALYPTLRERVKYDHNLETSTLRSFIQGRIESGQGFQRLVLEESEPDLNIFSEAELQFYRSQGVDISIVRAASWDIPIQLASPWRGLPEAGRNSRYIGSSGLYQ
ncbi:hypothetical protein MSAN_01551000 [Mycena sanguinolenta]|uniref:Uncharacterized protein n=1 Tax=Mycena sanguinolenta TaxID=230812 RepID=A0A8H6Y3U6_9AGAR|nr:hypothetical protein MSAN_01551000 [Mycena sanguinolenta]